jgi:hypothetical protein
MDSVDYMYYTAQRLLVKGGEGQSCWLGAEVVQMDENCGKEVDTREKLHQILLPFSLEG